MNGRASSEQRAGVGGAVEEAARWARAEGGVVGDEPSRTGRHLS